MATVGKLLFLCFLMSGMIVGKSLFLLELFVPSQVDIREKARMICRFDLDGDHFFSLKWYKEEWEFFRVMPEFFTKAQTFPVEGVHVVESESNMSVVTLYPLDYKSSGMYRCEVSGGAPHFKVVYKNSNMTVLGLPQGNPKIYGLKERYEIGNVVSANCTSSPSYPPAIMNWYINGLQAQQLFIDYYNLDESRNELNLQTRTIGLRFQTNSSHFLQRKNETLSLVCSATVGHITRSTETRVYLSQARRENYVQGTGNGLHNLKPSFYIMIIFIVFVKFFFVF